KPRTLLRPALSPVRCPTARAGRRGREPRRRGRTRPAETRAACDTDPPPRAAPWPEVASCWEGPWTGVRLAGRGGRRADVRGHRPPRDCHPARARRDCAGCHRGLVFSTLDTTGGAVTGDARSGQRPPIA